MVGWFERDHLRNPFAACPPPPIIFPVTLIHVLEVLYQHYLYRMEVHYSIHLNLVQRTVCVQAVEKALFITESILSVSNRSSSL